jgi:hypothetical protein
MPDFISWDLFYVLLGILDASYSVDVPPAEAGELTTVLSIRPSFRLGIITRR